MGKRPKQTPEDATAIATATASDVNGDSGRALLSVDALSKLAQTIQTGFEKAKVQSKENPAHTTKGKKGKKGVKDLLIGKPEESTPQNSNDRRKSNGKKPSRKETEKPAEHANDTRGKKRARDGRPKPQTATALRQKPVPHASGTGKETLPQTPGKKNRVDKEAFLKGITELGGTQEDLDLVNDIDSDSEIEETEFSEQPSGKAGKNLKSELTGFMKEIGLERAKSSAPADKGDEHEGWREKDGDKNMGGYKEEKTAPLDTFATPSVQRSKCSKLLFLPRPDWHAHPLPELMPTTVPTPSQTETLHKRGKELLTTENVTYSTTHLTKSSDRQFLSTIMTSGTLTDKISALTLICQESPLHTTKTLETLLGLAQKKSRSQAVSAMGAIKDLFASGMVLPNRKLKFFNKQQGLGSADVMNVHLLVWAYEDWLKNFYFEVLKTLEGLCSDQLEFARSHAVGYVWELLKERPEQEANLLRLLVNKLGDTNKKVSSKVSFLLLKLQSTHPAMKSIIINFIESEVVFRLGNNMHAKYYAIITLNQTILSTREVEVANKLLSLYFAVFTSLLKDNKDAATGVNATGLGLHTISYNKPAPPPAKESNINRKVRLRAETEGKGKQFTEEMNAKLISAVLTGVNRAFPFSQVDDEVFQKHMDTLFRITHSGNFNTSIQALLLIFQVANSKQAVSDRFYRTLYESLLDQRLVGSSKQAMYLNLLFKALKADTQIKRVKAFVKRVIQISTFHQPPFICGVLFLLGELETAVPSLHSLMDTPQETLEDDEEVFRDVPEEEGGEKKEATEGKVEDRVEYDGRKRDPSHANADRSCLWELLPFLNYYHPSVALFASHLLEQRKMPSKPDLRMHTLTHFLDRFVYRNARSAPLTSRGGSIMQPLSGGDTRGMVLSTRGAGKSQVPVNSDTFWKRKVEEVAVDEVFFHKYFNQVAPKKATAAGKKKSEDSEAEEEENEEEIWKALVRSRPELEEDDMDSDVDFSDDEDINADVDEDEVASDGEVGEDEDSGNSPGFDDGGDDFWSDDDDVPDDLAEAFETELQVANKKKAKVVEAPAEDEGGDRKKKKRKLKSLPTFASADDYADMLSD